MNTTIYFVRHGQTDANKARIFSGQIDTPLNDTVREQVKTTCNLIQELNIKWDIIISSTLSRAYETAQIINKNFNVKIINDDRLKELLFGTEAPDIIIIFMGSNDCGSQYVKYDTFKNSYNNRNFASWI